MTPSSRAPPRALSGWFSSGRLRKIRRYLLRDICSMFGNLWQAHQFAEGSSCQRTGDVKAVDGLIVIVDNTRLQVAGNAEPGGIGMDDAIGGKRRQEWLTIENAAMGGAGGDDNGVEIANQRAPAP